MKIERGMIKSKKEIPRTIDIFFAVGGLIVTVALSKVFPGWTSRHDLAFTLVGLATGGGIYVGIVAIYDRRKKLAEQAAVEALNKAAAQAKQIRLEFQDKLKFDDHLSAEWEKRFGSFEVGRKLKKDKVEHVLSAPPTIASFLLSLVPDRDRDALFGDIEEKYWTRYIPKYGVRTARRKYLWEVSVTITVFLGDKIVRLATLINTFRGAK